MATLKINQEIDLAFTALDAIGNPAQVDGIPTWASSDPEVAEVVPAENGLSARARAGLKLGRTEITVTADADLGEDVANITSPPFLVDVVAGQAVSIEIVPGEIRELAG